MPSLDRARPLSRRQDTAIDAKLAKRKPAKAGLAALFCLALAPRLMLALSLPADDTVFVDRPYLEYARHFAQGEGFWCTNPYDGLDLDRAYAYRPTLFPFLWGLAYNVTNGAYPPIRVAHAVVSSIACLFAFAVGRDLFGDRRVAWLGAGMAALYPPLVWHSVHLMTEPLFILFTMLAVWGLLRAAREEGFSWSLGVGVAMGLGTLTRSVLVGFAPLAGVWLWVARGRSRKAAAGALALWAAMGAVMAPWIVRNALVFGEFVPSTTDFGHGFYVANNEHSLDDPRGFWTPESWEFLQERPDEQINELDARRRLTRMTVEFIRENKATYAKLVATRVWGFWRPWPRTGFVSARHAAVYGASFVPAFLLMVPGFVLAWRSGERRDGHALVLLLVVFMTGIHAMILVMLRYRVPLMPVLLMYSAYSLVRGWDRLAGRGAAPRDFDDVAERYDDALPEHVQEHYAGKRARLLNALSTRGLGLDVGCGTGRLAAKVDCSKGVVGVDLSLGMLREMKGKGRGDAARADCVTLPFADGAFDLVWCVATLHHLAEPERVEEVIREMLRVARAGGHVVIWDHNPANPYWPVAMARAPQDSGAERLVPAREIEDALRRAGASDWRLIRSGWVPDFAPKRLMWLFRAAEAVCERTPLLLRLSAHNVFVIKR